MYSRFDIPSSASCDETMRKSFEKPEQEHRYPTITFCEPDKLSVRCQKSDLMR